MDNWVWDVLCLDDAQLVHYNYNRCQHQQQQQQQQQEERGDDRVTVLASSHVGTRRSAWEEMMTSQRSTRTFTDNQFQMPWYQIFPVYHDQVVEKDVVVVQDDDSNSYSSYYYLKCFAGGICASSIRWIKTPVDCIKCNMQVHPQQVPNFSTGWMRLWQAGGVSALYTGLGPTMLSYGSQTALKYSLYEYFKNNTAALNPQHYNDDDNHRWRWMSHGTTSSLLLVSAAATAEAVAVIFMCPWEMLKVRVQTSALAGNPAATAASLTSARAALVYPIVTSSSSSLTALQATTAATATTAASSTRLVPAAWQMFVVERVYPWGSLRPLWARQIPGTVANFYTFETAVQWIYENFLFTPDKPRKDCFTSSTQLTVTLMAGYMAGLVSTIVSQPADALVSLRARPEFAGQSTVSIVRLVGWKKLFLRGLTTRLLLNGSILGMQWWIYDSFKTAMGMGTTGGK